MLGNAGTAFDTASQYAKPIGTAMQTAQALTPPSQPMQPPPQLQRTPMNLSEMISQGQQMRQFDEQEAMRRRQLMQQYAGNIGRF
jgi:hypothetical protein